MNIVLSSKIFNSNGCSWVCDTAKIISILRGLKLHGSTSKSGLNSDFQKYSSILRKIQLFTRSSLRTLTYNTGRGLYFHKAGNHLTRTMKILIFL